MDLVKFFKLHILTIRFENLRMKEEESISEFNARLCDIASKVIVLGEKFTEENLVQKTLRSLPKRFAFKVTTTKEAKDVQSMKIEELTGSLRTFKMNFEEEEVNKKANGIAFQAESNTEQMKLACDDDDDINDAIVDH